MVNLAHCRKAGGPCGPPARDNRMPVEIRGFGNNGTENPVIYSMTTSTPEDAPMLLPHALAPRVLWSASVTNAGFFQGTGVVKESVKNRGQTIRDDINLPAPGGA